MGQTYVPIEGIGFSSYHFDKDGSYISYAAATDDWLLSDRSKVPDKKYFLNQVYTPEDRTCKATISWAPVTFNGDSTWDFTMVFSPDFKFIEDGTIVAKDAKGNVLTTHHFGTFATLSYSLKTPDKIP